MLNVLLLFPGATVYKYLLMHRYVRKKLVNVMVTRYGCIVQMCRYFKLKHPNESEEFFNTLYHLTFKSNLHYVIKLHLLFSLGTVLISKL